MRGLRGFLTILICFIATACGKMRNADFGSRATASTQGLQVGTSTQRISIAGQTDFPARTCAGLTIRTEDEHSNERAVETPTQILLNTSGDGVFHSASDCNSASRTNTLVFDAGDSTKPVYYFSNRGETGPVLSASAPSTSLTAGSITVNPIPAPITELAILGPRAGRINNCIGPYTLQFRNVDHLPEKTTSSTQVDFTLGLNTTLYTESLCSNPVTSVTVPAQQSSTSFYLRSTTAQVETLTASNFGFGVSLSAQVSFSSRFSTFTQVAGRTNPYGFANGDGLTDARFMSPSKLTNDGTHIYILEAMKRIRRYTPMTGQVITVVGNAADSNSSLYRDGYGPLLRTDGGGFIMDIVADSSHLYFNDFYCIRRMNLSTMMVETIVGSCTTSGAANGIGTSARLPWIHFLTLDPVLRRLYAANHSSVWQIDLETLQTRLIAGDATTTGNLDGVGAAARFNLNQGGLLVRPDGNLLLGEFDKLREMDHQTHAVSLIQSGAYQQENMVSVGSTYYAFNSAQTEYLRSFNLGPYSSQTLFNNQLGATRDGDSSTASITGARGLTALNGDLYFSQTNSHVIRRINLAVMTISTVAGSNGFDYGGTTTSDFKSRNTNIIASNGSTLYISDRVNCNIRSMDTTTGAVEIIAGSTAVSWYQDMSRCQSADGTGGPAGIARFTPEIGQGVISGTSLYVSDGGRIKRIDLASPTLDVVTLAGSSSRGPPTDGVGTLAILANPGALAVIGDDLFFADAFSIRKLNLLNNTVSTLAGSTSSGTVDGPAAGARFTWISGLAVFGTGTQLVVSDQYTIRLFDPLGGTVTRVTGQASPPVLLDGPFASATFMNIRGLSFRNDMGSYYLYIDDVYGLREVDLDNGIVSSLNGTTQSSPAVADKNGPLHQAATSPLGYFVNMPFLPDGALYLPTGQGIRKLH